jgi:hypothetical protein
MQQNNDNNVPNNLLIQSDYVNNPFIKAAFEYFKQLSIPDKQLITDYKSEMDSDDWTDKPLEITYTVINWILQHKSRKLVYMPELIESGALTKQQFTNQILSAKKLNSILSNFPQIKDNSINVYRGDTTELGNYIIKNLKNNQISIYSFLSTSVNLSVATNFSSGCLLCINIPSGNPIPFISDKLTMNYSFDINNQDTSESEVLLPLGCTLKLLANYDNIQVNGKKVNLIYLQLISFGPHNTRNFWLNYVKTAENLYDKIQKDVKQEERDSKSESEVEGGSRKYNKKKNSTRTRNYRKVSKNKKLRKSKKNKKSKK